MRNARTVLNFTIVYDGFLFRQLLTMKNIPSAKVVEEIFASTKVVEGIFASTTFAEGIFLSRKIVDDYFRRNSSRTKTLVDIT